MFKKMKNKICDQFYKEKIADKNRLKFTEKAVKEFWNRSKKNELDINPLSLAFKSFLDAKNAGHLDSFNRPTTSMAKAFMGAWV